MRGLLFAIALLFALPASAQENTWDLRFEQAMSQELPSHKVDALLALFKTEPDYQNRIVAGYNAMAIAYESQRYETAAKVGEKTLQMTDEYAQGNLKQRDAIAEYLIAIYFHDDQPREADRVIDENLRMNDAALDDLWAPSGKSIIHRFSAMTCPNQIGELYRESTRIYHPTGIDVGCDYKAYNGEDNTISVYFSKYDLRNISSKKVHDNVIESVRVNWGEAELSIDNQESDFKTLSGGEVRESLFRLGSLQKGYRYTGTWTSVIDSWVLKSRITWDGKLGENFGHEHAKALLMNTSADIKPHLEFCKTPAAETDAQRLDAKTTQSLTSLLTLMADDSEKSDEGRPVNSCMGKASEEGNAIMEWYKNSVRLYSIVGSAVDEDVYVSADKLTGLLNDSAPVHFSLKSVKLDSETEDKTTRILAVYSGKPSQSQVFQDYVAYRKGELQTLGSVVQQKGGDMHVNVVGIGEE